MAIVLHLCVICSSISYTVYNTSFIPIRISLHGYSSVNTSDITLKDSLYLLAFFLILIDTPPCSMVAFLDNYNDNDDSTYNHAVIIGEISPIDLEIYFYGHSANRNGKRYNKNGDLNKSLQDHFDDYPDGKISLCVINRSWYVELLLSSV